MLPLGDGGFKMIDGKDVRKIILNKIADYEKIIHELEPNKQNRYVRESLEKYYNYIECLHDLNKQLFELVEFNDHAAFERLIMNYEKYDTEFIFINDSSFTVKKDDVCSFKDNHILIYNKEEVKKDPTVIPPVEVSINLDNVKLIRTVK